MRSNSRDGAGSAYIGGPCDDATWPRFPIVLTILDN
jgi:hypothetical protein